MSEFKVTYKTRNVNSKRMFKEFQTLIEEVCDEYIIHRSSILDKTYDYEELVGFLNMYYEDLVEKNVITQFDVIADKRINEEKNIRDGKIKVLVKFRQTNCLNVTQYLVIFRV